MNRNYEKVPVPALYCHIPFCRNICPFCSFAVIRSNPEKQERYLNLLAEEYALLSSSYTLNFDGLKSIYLGGGTPTALSHDQLQKLSVWLKSLSRQAENAQWSIEVNPEDLDKKRMQLLMNLGTVRISLGVQSFSLPALQRLGRMHTPEQSRAALELIQTEGCADFNIDIMFGYPDQSFREFTQDLEEALFWTPSHISLYALTIEPRTALYRKPACKKWIEAHEQEITAMYEWAVHRLEAAGLFQYEVSNFAREGYHSIQNLINWSGRNYLGLGMGAHSLLFPFRWGNRHRWIDYRKALERGELPFKYREKLSRTMQRDEELMLGLRQREGLDLALFRQKHGVSFSDDWQRRVDLYCEKGFLITRSNRLLPTVKGLLLADEISAGLAALL